MFINENATPKEKDKRWNRLFNCSAAFANLTMVLSLASQNYHDDIRAELNNDPEGICDRYYLANKDKTEAFEKFGGQQVSREVFVKKCTKTIKDMPKDSPIADLFSNVALGWTGLAGFGIWAWNRNRRQHPELSKPSSNNHEPQ